MPNYRSPGVYVEEVEAGSRPIEGVGTAVAAFVGFTARGPRNEAVRLTSWGQFTRAFGDFVPGAYLPLSVFHYFNNGGGACYVVSVGSGGDDPTGVPLAELTSATRPGVITYRVEAADRATRASLAVEVTSADQTGGRGSAPATDGTPGGESPAEPETPDPTFTVVVKQDGRPVESFANLTTRRGRRNAVTVVNEQSRLVRLREVDGVPVADRVPVAGEVLLRGAEPAPAPSAGSEDYVGDVTARTGVGGLTAYDDITMLAAPDLMFCYEQGQLDLNTVQAVQQAMIDHCENMGDRMAILDPPPGLNAQQIRDWVRERARYDSKFATIYWPWVAVFDPVEGHNRFIPPSGPVAGIWGRSDDTRGVHKAPANEVVRGALDLESNITRGEHDSLNPAGINVIRAFPGRGIRVWGARTLSSDPAWRYVNVRRLFNYLEASILGGTQWAVFEPNDLELWQRLRRTVGAFLLRMWRDGALFGATAEQAFYVKCDEETNPPEVVEAGQVVIEIGVAPVKPAEFVVFRIAQLGGGGGVDE
ncbi:phage tail sheath subtilisin-like domain-containing protein [Frankia sp. Cj5]|uniref:phage tail sheath family protein n=1 Tax=Frankia sp. Cj5 TaxID=2880978 RepID=UPI001EF67F47|nr:phage tail sheath subtilisin-like domain-containing protein [Frankia sp. Cj5]